VAVGNTCVLTGDYTIIQGDIDAGAYIASNSDAFPYCRQDLTQSNPTQDNGFIVVNVGDVPAASSDPMGAYGFVRFRAQVD
jgi:hypothetical protein